MRFAFAGTPQFAAQVLRHLVEIGRRPALVISAPDRPKGRGRKSAPPDAVVAAAGLCIPCLQVDDINSPETVSVLADAHASVLVVAAFGRLLRPALLERFTCMNVHASLLPAYRGAAPIERAIAAGEGETGISIMRMTEGLDEGPWAVRRRLSIGLRDDAGSISRCLAVLGAVALDQVLTGLEDGNVTWTEQEGPSSYAEKLSPADTVLDSELPARALHNRVRSLSPGTGATMTVGDLNCRVWRTWPYGGEGLPPVPVFVEDAAGRPGRLALGANRLFVGCAEGALEILSLQPGGRGKMTAAEFLRGYHRRVGGPSLGGGVRSSGRPPRAVGDARDEETQDEETGPSERKG